MDLIINGDTLTIPSTIETITALLQHLDIKNESAIVEHNENILNKAMYNHHKVTAGDRLEIVHFVGGG